MPHSAFGDDVIGKLLHFFPRSFQDCYLHAAFMVQVNMKRRLGEVVMIVKVSGEPLRQFALVMVVDVDQCGETRFSAGRLHRMLVQAGSSQIADCLGAIGIAVSSHVALQLRAEIIVYGDCDALHAVPHVVESMTID